MKIQEYLSTHTSPESALLAALNRETHAKVLMPQMLSGHLQGEFLRIISFLMQPRRILEIGTFTGYSAICLAAGLPPDGLLHTIDINEELEHIQTHYFEQAGLSKKIKLHIGNALNIITGINEVFDLVFIDADKQNYSNYYDLVIDKVRLGGLILADNALFSGKVLEEPITDASAKAIHAFNEKVQADERVENLLLPLRDGIMMVRKKG